MLCEDEIFEVFRKRCENAGFLSRPGGLSETDAVFGVNDDQTLWRFLRADNVDVEKAFLRFQNAHTTRQRLKLPQAYDEIDVDDFEKARMLYPHWTGRRDKQGKPLCFFDVAKLDATVLREYSTVDASSALIRPLVFHDCLTRFVLPLCSKASPTKQPVTSCLYLVDVSSFGIKQAWNVRNYAADISKVLANDYPEMIDKVLVIGAPRLFGQIWKIIKGWIDPATAAKIEILDSQDVLKQLTVYVELEDLPVQFGGKLDFRHGMVPKADPGARAVLDVCLTTPNQQLAGPFKWVNGGAIGEKVVPVGTVADARR